jgi:hypothetical protein
MRKLYLHRVKGSKKTQKNPGIGKLLSVCLMIFCLAFLTSINFFLYPSQDTVAASKMSSEQSSDTKKSNFPPSGPTEEKSSSSGSISIAEEILHENHPEFNFVISNHIYLHHIAEADNIEMFHPELVSPPPKA